jgi:hypothetical protein
MPHRIARVGWQHPSPETHVGSGSACHFWTWRHRIHWLKSTKEHEIGFVWARHGGNLPAEPAKWAGLNCWHSTQQTTRRAHRSERLTATQLRIEAMIAGDIGRAAGQSYDARSDQEIMPCIFSARIKRQFIAPARTAGATAQRWGPPQSLSDLSIAEIDQRATRAGAPSSPHCKTPSLRPSISAYGHRVGLMPTLPAGRSTNGPTRSCLRSRLVRSASDASRPIHNWAAQNGLA